MQENNMLGILALSKEKQIGKNQKNEKIDTLKAILLKIIRVGVVLTLFTPLIFSVFITCFDVIFFRSAIEIIFALYLFLVLLDKTYLPKVSPILIFILIFDAILIVSSFFGINFYHSFFGDLERGDGIITHLHLLAFFVILISIFWEKEGWLDLFKMSVFSSVICSFTAILQQLRVPPFYDIAVDQLRLSGTLMNPDHFAAYINLSIFMAIFLFIAEKKKNLKAIWLCAIALNYYTLFFSSARGSLLSAGLGFAIILFPLFTKLDYRKRIIGLTFIFILCILALVMFLNLGLFENTVLGNTLNRFTEFNLAGRGDIWKAVVPAFSVHPILGWGYESFTYVSDKYMTSGVLSNSVFDRAHNKVLEVLTYAGIVGLISYLLIFAAIFYRIFKYKKSVDSFNDKFPIKCSLIVAVFFICYFAQNIFLFDINSTYLLFFLMAGFVNNNFVPQNDPVKEHSDNQYKNKLGYKVKILFFAGILLVAALVAYEINIKPAISEAYLHTRFSDEITAKKAFSKYKEAIGRNTVYDKELKNIFISKALSMSESSNAESFKKDIVKSLADMKPFLYQNIETDYQRINSSYLWLAAICEQEYLVNKDSKYLDEMSEVIKKAMAFNLNVASFYNYSGELKILQDNYEGGEADIKKSCVIDKCEDGKLYERMGLAYSKKGDIFAKAKNFQKELDIYYGYQQEKSQYALTPVNLALLTNYVGTIYCQELNDLQNCAKVFEKGMNNLPEYSGALVQRLEQLKLESK